MVGIYKIENKITHKAYIGQSVDIDKRFRQHRSNAFNKNSKSYNLPLYVDIRKFGLDNFSFTILELCDISELSSREHKYILSANDTYNIVLSPNSFYGYKVTESKILNIIHLLEECDLKHKDIALVCDVSVEVVDSINTGRGYKLPYISYPIVDYKELSKLNKLCPYCNVTTLSKGASICLDCYNKYRKSYIKSNGIVKPTREKLKEYIRLFSFVEVGRIFGVSDNAVRKWCKNYNLPSKSSDIKSIPIEVWDTL